MERNWFVYILTNKRNGTFYIGVTSDFPKRMWEHRNKSDPDSFTAKHDLNILVYYEQHAYWEHAIQREKLIKKWKRKWKLDLIESFNPDWQDLADRVHFS